MKKILPAIFLPVAVLGTGCQQTTVHTHQTSAALAGATSSQSSRPGSTSAAAVSSSTISSNPRNVSARTTAVVVGPAPRAATAPAPAPAPARKPEKREVYEEQTSEVVETYVFPASDEEIGR